MTWKIHDEFIDLARSRHVAIFRNGATGAEHHLIHEFCVPACPHCGHLKMNDGEPIDFHKHKADTLVLLNAHHKKQMQYHAKHPHVRLGSGPK